MLKKLTSEYKKTANGRCPDCDSNDWKLAKIVYESGLDVVALKTDGSGSSIGVGVGRGQGGVYVESQSYSEDTEGTIQSDLSKRFSPPQKNENIETSHQLLAEVEQTKQELVKYLEKIAEESRSFYNSIPSEYTINGKKSELYDLLLKLNEALSYEISLELWEKSRVCQRCNAHFLTNSDISTIKDPIIPTSSFPGSNKVCCHCMSYRWRHAASYRANKIFSLESEQRRMSDEKSLDESKLKTLLEEKIATRDVNNGGIFNKAKAWGAEKLRNINISLTESGIKCKSEAIEKIVEELNLFKDEKIFWKNFHEQEEIKDFVRFCLNCNEVYVIQ